MYIKVSNSAREIKDLDLKEEIVVVIDVLRATSTMINALNNGVKEIYTFASVEDAREFKKKNKEVILGGERNAKKPHDFDCGNSPLEYKNFSGKMVALTTTNGTLALSNAKGAKEILIMSNYNYKATSDYLVKKKENIRFVCAGTNGEFSLDDAFCAVKGIEYILSQKDDYELDDMSKLLLCNIKDEKEIVKKAKHYSVLEDLEYFNDLEYCLNIGDYRFIGRVEGEKIVRVNI